MNEAHIISQMKELINVRQNKTKVKLVRQISIIQGKACYKYIALPSTHMPEKDQEEVYTYLIHNSGNNHNQYTSIPEPVYLYTLPSNYIQFDIYIKIQGIQQTRYTRCIILFSVGHYFPEKNSGDTL